MVNLFACMLMSMYMNMCLENTEESSAQQTGFAFSSGNKVVSILGGEVSFRIWLYDLWKVDFHA